MAYRTGYTDSREEHYDKGEFSANESGSDDGRKTGRRVKDEYLEQPHSYAKKNHGEVQELVEHAAEFVRNKLGYTQNDKELSDEESSEDDDANVEAEVEADADADADIEEEDDDAAVAATTTRAPTQRNWTQDDTQSYSQHQTSTQPYRSNQTYTSNRSHTDASYHEAAHSQSAHQSYTSSQRHATIESRTTAQPHTASQSYSTSQSYTNSQPHLTGQEHGNDQPHTYASGRTTQSYETGQSYTNTPPLGYSSHNTPQSHTSGSSYENNRPHVSPPRASDQPRSNDQSYPNNHPHTSASRTAPQSYSSGQSYSNTQSRPNNQSYVNTQPRMGDPRINAQPQISTQSQQTVSEQSGRKKGMGWPWDNPASLFPLFTTPSPSVHWLMNWELWVPEGLPNTVEWIPVVRTPAQINEVIPKLTEAITNQRRLVPALLGFNEPEVSDQANMSVEDAVKMWREVVVPAKHQFNLRLGSPCMSSNTQKSKPWLSQFFDQLHGQDEVDFLVLHYYGSSVEDMKRFLQDMHDTYCKPIWLNEFACSKLDNGQASEQEVLSFIQEAVPWLEGTDWIERYAYFGMGQNRQVTSFVGEASNFLQTGGDPSTDGKRLSGVAEAYLRL